MKYVLVALAVISSLAGCRRDKIIIDDDLRAIFREIYLTNAYMEQYRGRLVKFSIDSIDVYRPILERYGYTVSDLEHTVKNFSSRKSYRLTDVVDEVIAQLEKEEDNFKYRIAAKDSVEARAKQMFRRLVYEDSVVTARRIADTAKLKKTIPIVDSGEYEIRYSYYIDSTEENRGLRNTFTALNSTGGRRQVLSSGMASNRRQRYNGRIMPAKGDTALLITWGGYPAKEMKRPGLLIDSIELYYTPPLATALDSAAILTYRYSISIDSLWNEKDTQDSIALRLHTSGIVEERGSDD